MATAKTIKPRKASILKYTSSGVKSSTKLDIIKELIIDRENKDILIKEAYLYNQNNLRVNLARTKTRGLIRGGGKKPWRQKGTGRARFGSSRNPIWRGGGIVFGPTGNENYKTKLNKKARVLALKLALSTEIIEGNVSIIENLNPSKPDTNKINKLLKKIGLSRNILIVADELTKNLELSTRNIASVKLIKYTSLNVNDLLDSDHILFTLSAFNETTKLLVSSKSTEVTN